MKCCNIKWANNKHWFNINQILHLISVETTSSIILTLIHSKSIQDCIYIVPYKLYKILEFPALASLVALVVCVSLSNSLVGSVVLVERFRMFWCGVICEHRSMVSEMAESELHRCYNNKNNVQNEFLQEENEILKQKLEIHMNLWDLDKQQMESDFFAVGVLFTIYFRKLCVDNFFSCFVFNFVSRRHEITILESLFFFHFFSLSTSQAMYLQSLFSFETEWKQ